MVLNANDCFEDVEDLSTGRDRITCAREVGGEHLAVNQAHVHADGQLTDHTGKSRKVGLQITGNLGKGSCIFCTDGDRLGDGLLCCSMSCLVCLEVGLKLLLLCSIFLEDRLKVWDLVLGNCHGCPEQFGIVTATLKFVKYGLLLCAFSINL